jgi:hypothetical protein
LKSPPSISTNTTKQDDEDNRIPLLFIAPPVAASGLRGPQDDDAILCHLFVATGSAAEEHGDETFVKYQCMFDNDESRRRHEIDLPEAFLKEHQRIIMQNPVLRIPRCHHEHSFTFQKMPTSRFTPRLLPAPIGSESGTSKILTVRVISNALESKAELQGACMALDPMPRPNGLNPVQEMLIRCPGHPGHYVG